MHNGWCELFSRDPTWAQDVCVREECHCRVYCNRLWCDQRCKGSTSTPPRVARLCQIREASQRISKKSTLAHVCRSFDLSNPPYSYPVTCRVTRRHCTTCKVNSSRSAQYPYQASISMCGIVHVPALSSQYHSNSHQSWLMTSSAVSEIPNLEWRRISCECVSSCDSLFVSLPLRALCCCLLSRVSGMTAQSLSG